MKIIIEFCALYIAQHYLLKNTYLLPCFSVFTSFLNFLTFGKDPAAKTEMLPGKYWVQQTYWKFSFRVTKWHTAFQYRENASTSKLYLEKYFWCRIFMIIIIFLLILLHLITALSHHSKSRHFSAIRVNSLKTKMATFMKVRLLRCWMWDQLLLKVMSFFYCFSLKKKMCIGPNIVIKSNNKLWIPEWTKWTAFCDNFFKDEEES